LKGIYKPGYKEMLECTDVKECHKTRLPNTCYQKYVQMNLCETVRHGRINIHTNVKKYLILLRDLRITYFINVFVTL